MTEREHVADQLTAVREGMQSARVEAGLGVREVARQAFVSPGTVRNLEAGTSEPDYRQGARVAAVLDRRFELVMAAAGSVRPGPYDELRLPNLWFLPLAVRQPVPPSTELDTLAWGFMRVMAAQIGWARIHAGWSDEHAALECGVSPKTLRRFQYGEGWPTLRAITTIAHRFDASLVLTPLSAPWPAMPWQGHRPNGAGGGPRGLGA